jgi:hypothetical protein
MNSFSRFLFVAFGMVALSGCAGPVYYTSAKTSDFKFSKLPEAERRKLPLLSWNYLDKSVADVVELNEVMIRSPHSNVVLSASFYEKDASAPSQRARVDIDCESVASGYLKCEKYSKDDPLKPRTVTISAYGGLFPIFQGDIDARSPSGMKVREFNIHGRTSGQSFNPNDFDVVPLRINPVEKVLSGATESILAERLIEQQLANTRTELFHRKKCKRLTLTEEFFRQYREGRMRLHNEEIRKSLGNLLLLECAHRDDEPSYAFYLFDYGVVLPYQFFVSSHRSASHLGVWGWVYERDVCGGNTCQVYSEDSLIGLSIKKKN